VRYIAVLTVQNYYNNEEKSEVMAIREIDLFEPSAVEILVRCKQLVEQMLKDEYKALDWLERENRNTKFTEIKIARMEYALGIRKDFPNVKEMLERKM
jgi:hypothetical protein